jgi:hypothetical protein
MRDHRVRNVLSGHNLCGGLEWPQHSARDIGGRFFYTDASSVCPHAVWPVDPAQREGEAMDNLDPVAWGWGFFSTGIAIAFFILAILLKRLPPLVSAGGLLVALILIAWGAYLLIEAVRKVPDVPAKLPGEPTQLPSASSTPRPTIESIFPPETAIDIRPSLGVKTASFTLSNWVSWGASEIEATTWMRTNGSFAKLGTRRYPYLGIGDSVSLTEQLLPSTNITIAICISYLLNNHHVEVIHFFSNADGAGYRRARDSIFEVDRQSGLCKSMPGPAVRAL